MQNGSIINMLRQKMPIILYYLAVLTPPVAILLMIRHFAVNVPIWDDWEIPSLLAKLYAGNLTLADLWAQHNEHRMVFPRLIILVLAYLTNYNLVAQMYAGFALRLLSLLLITRLLDLTLPQSRAALRPSLTILASFLLFSAVEHENWTWGFTAIPWNLTVLCVIITAWGLARWPAQWTGILVALVSTFIGTFSLAGGIILWGVGLLGIIAYNWICRKKIQWLQVIFWITAAIVIIAAYLTNYYKPHPVEFVLTNLVDVIIFILAYLGAPFSQASGYQSSAVLGFLGVVGLGVAIYRIARDSPGAKGHIVPWLMLTLFALPNAAITAIGRAGYGPELALGTRYVSVSILFWLSVLAVILIGFWQDLQDSHTPVRFGNIIMTAVVIALLPGYITSYIQGLSILKQKSQGLTTALDYLYDYEIVPDEIFQRMYPEGLRFRDRFSVIGSLRLSFFSNNVSARNPRLYAEPSIPAEAAVGELTQNIVVSQTFISRCKQLSRFDLQFATQGREHIQQPVVVRLTDMETGQQVYEETISISEINDNGWRQFLFEPLPHSAGKTYRISLFAPNSQPGEAITLWRSQTDAYPGGEAFVNDSPIHSDLAFRYGCAPLPTGATRLDLSSGFPSEMITWTTFVINDQTKDVIFAHPLSSIAWPIILPENKSVVLETFLGLNPLMWGEPISDGATFNVQVESVDGTITSLFSRHVDPYHNEQDRQWIPVRVDLSQYAGQAIALWLETDTGPAGNGNFDWAGWASPVLTVSQ